MKIIIWIFVGLVVLFGFKGCVWSEAKEMAKEMAAESVKLAEDYKMKYEKEVALVEEYKVKYEKEVTEANQLKNQLAQYANASARMYQK